MKCKYCNRIFKYKKGLEKHQKRCTKDPAFKGHPCELCYIDEGKLRVYKTFDSWRVHQKTKHSKRRKPRCVYCTKEFSSTQYKQTHEKTCKGIYVILYKLYTYIYFFSATWTNEVFKHTLPSVPIATNTFHIKFLETMYWLMIQCGTTPWTRSTNGK